MYKTDIPINKLVYFCLFGLYRLRFWVAVISLCVGLLICPQLTYAANKSSTNSSGSTVKTTENISGGVTQSYNADSTVAIGMLVQLKNKDPSSVVPLSQSHIIDLLGVVVPSNNATIVLTPQKITQQQVLVATSGHFDVLVSNQNGPIKVGDYVTISSIDGVGMKANQIQDEVLGKAAGDFSGTTNVIGTVQLKSTLGSTTTVTIGRIPVDLSISHNPLYARAADYVPGFLSKVADTVANRPVSSARIYLSMAVLLITAMVTGNMLYSGVRSGMQAIGRNPLSKKSIIKSLLETVIAGLIIFVVGVLAVYLLLKL